MTLKHVLGAISPILFLGALAPSAGADDLPRRAFLGVGGQAGEGGLEVTRVLDIGTAGVAGVKIGDLIIEINDAPITTFSDLLSLASGLVEGDDATFKLRRDGKELQLAATTVGRPKEQSNSFDVIYDSVPFRGNQLRSIVYKPKGVEKAPAVYFLQGYNCASINHGFADWHPERKLVSAFAEAGFVVYRLERPGQGDSAGDLNCADIDYPTEQALFEAGLSALRKYAFTNRDSIFIFGHSLGGVTAPLIAAKHPVAGIATYGAVAKPWYEYMLDVYRDQNLRIGDPPIYVDNGARNATKFYYDLMVAKKPWTEILEAHAEAIQAGVAPISGEYLFNRHHRFWSTLNDVNLAQAWADYDGDALAIYGSYDIQAINSEAAEMTVRLVKAYPPGAATSLILENAEHGLGRFDGSFADYVAARNNGQWSTRTAGENFDSRITDNVIEWMNSVLIKRGG